MSIQFASTVYASLKVLPATEALASAVPPGAWVQAWAITIFNSTVSAVCEGSSLLVDVRNTSNTDKYYCDECDSDHYMGD